MPTLGGASRGHGGTGGSHKGNTHPLSPHFYPSLAYFRDLLGPEGYRAPVQPLFNDLDRVSGCRGLGGWGVTRKGAFSPSAGSWGGQNRGSGVQQEALGQVPGAGPGGAGLWGREDQAGGTVLRAHSSLPAQVHHGPLEAHAALLPGREGAPGASDLLGPLGQRLGRVELQQKTLHNILAVMSRELSRREEPGAAASEALGEALARILQLEEKVTPSSCLSPTP